MSLADVRVTLHAANRYLELVRPEGDQREARVVLADAVRRATPLDLQTQNGQVISRATDPEMLLITKVEGRITVLITLFTPATFEPWRWIKTPMIITRHAVTRYQARIDPEASAQAAHLALAEAQRACVRMEDRTKKGQVMWRVENPPMILITKHDAEADGPVIVTILGIEEYELERATFEEAKDRAFGHVQLGTEAT